MPWSKIPCVILSCLSLYRLLILDSKAFVAFDNNFLRRAAPVKLKAKPRTNEVISMLFSTFDVIVKNPCFTSNRNMRLRLVSLVFDSFRTLNSKSLPLIWYLLKLCQLSRTLTLLSNVLNSTSLKTFHLASLRPETSYVKFFNAKGHL